MRTLFLVIAFAAQTAAAAGFPPAVHLDRNGVMTSQRSLLPFQASMRVSLVPPAKSAVLRDGDHYEVVWTTSDGVSDAHTWRAIEPAAGGASTEPVHILDWSGNGYGTTIGKIDSTSIVITDALRSGISTNIDPVATTIANALSSTGTRQTTPEVAASGSAYAVIWNEFGPDGSAHLYLRRFAGSTAAPIIEIATNSEGKAIAARIAAVNGTYIIAWAASQNVSGTLNYVVRRMSAATGEWLDADAAPLTAARELVLASDGEGVLAAYTTDCSGGSCMHTRSIAAHDQMFAGAETTFSGTTSGELSLASNGHDYLLAWNDNLCLSFGCDVQLPARLLAQRLDADGHPLDFRSIVIDNTHFFAHDPSVAWTGTNYALSWDGGDAIYGRHVNAAGVTDATTTVIDRPPLLRSMSLVASSNNLFLLLSTQSGDVRSASGVAIDAQSLVATGVPSLIVSDQPADGTIAAAPLSGGLVFAYDRVDQAAGNVGRVFTRIFANVPRRRAAR